MTIKFKSFSVPQLKSISPEIFIKTEFEHKKGDFFTIGDCVHFEVHEGSENLYLILEVYRLDPDGYTPLILRIHTKENHSGLKEILAHLVASI